MMEGLAWSAPTSIFSMSTGWARAVVARNASAAKIRLMLASAVAVASAMPGVAHVESITYAAPPRGTCLFRRTVVSAGANEREAECRPRRRAGEEGEIAAVIEQDLARDGQAEAHAVADLARGDVRLEDARLAGSGEAGAGVAEVVGA